MVERWLVFDESAQLVELEELIAYETWHNRMWLGGEDQEAKLDYEGPSCRGEGQARGSGVMDH